MTYMGGVGLSKKVKMKDIADKLGVSVVAVSKALGNKPGISSELRTKVKRTADEIGYEYSSGSAPKKKTGGSYNICILVAEHFIGDESFYFKFFKHISKFLQLREHYAFFQTVSRKSEEEAILPKMLFRQHIDGVIVLGQLSKKYLAALAETKIPSVFLDFYNELVKDNCIICDSFYASYEMTNYLIRNGHRSIAFVGNIHSTSSIQDRFLGYEKSLIEHGIKLHEQFIISDRDTETGISIPIELPAIMPTAFVCNCDETACRLINQLKGEGYNVPEDISVTGFDNSVFSNISEPHITTIEVNTVNMSQIAVDSILQKIKTPSLSMGMIHVNGQIIYKDSVRSLNYE